MATYIYTGDYKYVISGTSNYWKDGAYSTANLSGNSGVEAITERIFTYGQFFVATASTAPQMIMEEVYGFNSIFKSYRFLITVTWRPNGSGWYYAYLVSSSSSSPRTYTGSTTFDNAAWVDFYTESSPPTSYMYQPNGHFDVYVPNTTLTNLKSVSNISVEFEVVDSAGRTFKTSYGRSGTVGGILKPVDPWILVTYSPTRKVLVENATNNLTVYCKYGSTFTGTSIVADSVTITPTRLAAHSASTISSAGTLAWGAITVINMKSKDIPQSVNITLPTDANGNPLIVSDFTKTVTNSSTATFASSQLASLGYQITATKSNHTFYSDTACTTTNIVAEKSVYTGGTETSIYAPFSNITSKTIYAKPTSIVQKAYLVFTESGDEYSSLTSGPVPSTINTYGGDDRTTYLKFLASLSVTGNTSSSDKVFANLSGLTGTTTGTTNTGANAVTVGAYQNTSHMFDGLHYYGAFARITFNTAPINAYAVTSYRAYATFTTMPIEYEKESMTFINTYSIPGGSIGNSGIFLIKSGWTAPWEYVVTFPITKIGAYQLGKIATYDYFCRKLACISSAFFIGEWNSFADMVDSYKITCQGFTGMYTTKTVSEHDFGYDDELGVLAGDIVGEYDYGSTPAGKQFSHWNVPSSQPGTYDANQSIKTKDLLLEDN